MYTRYEVGLAELERLLASRNKLLSMSPFHQQLIENIAKSRLFSMNRDLESERSIIIHKLSELSLHEFNISFMSLCDTNTESLILSASKKEVNSKIESNEPFQEEEHSILPETMAKLGYTVVNIDDCDVIFPPPLCTVPVSPFFMGTPQSDRYYSDASPRSKITYLDTYLLSPYPVTVAEYACAVNAGAVLPPEKPTKPQVRSKRQFISWKEQLAQLDHPVVCVSWYEARAYTEWLKKLTAQAWRLPTEAEWEKAAKGEDELTYPWGHEWDLTRVNMQDSYGKGTVPVGFYAKGASPYGVHDMAGNISEWTSSLCWKYPYARSDGREKPNTKGKRVIRGGSWKSPEISMRTYYRNSEFPDDISKDRGFRLACSIPEDF